MQNFSDQNICEESWSFWNILPRISAQLQENWLLDKCNKPTYCSKITQDNISNFFF